MDGILVHYSSKFRTVAGRYGEARRGLHAPASLRSRRGIDWMNFFIADVQTGFGLLLIGFALEPVRTLLLAATGAYPALVAAQVLSGAAGAIIGVLTVIVITDLTAGTGRFNLAISVLGALGGIAASISTTVTGYLFQMLGPHLGYVPPAAFAALATAILWVFLAETKPEKYED
jgi:hypothetical protein